MLRPEVWAMLLYNTGQDTYTYVDGYGSAFAVLGLRSSPQSAANYATVTAAGNLFSLLSVGLFFEGLPPRWQALYCQASAVLLSLTSLLPLIFYHYRVLTPNLYASFDHLNTSLAHCTALHYTRALPHQLFAMLARYMALGFLNNFLLNGAGAPALSMLTCTLGGPLYTAALASLFDLLGISFGSIFQTVGGHLIDDKCQCHFEAYLVLMGVIGVVASCGLTWFGLTGWLERYASASTDLRRAATSHHAVSENRRNEEDPL